MNENHIKIDEKLRREIERLTGNAAKHRENLLIIGLRKSKRRKFLNVIAGILALLSAAAITAVITDVFGQKVFQVIAALVAGLSGTISLVITSYFSDDEIINMITGSSKYLNLRESVYRLVIDPTIPNKKRHQILYELQDEYTRLDETYSRYFSVDRRMEMNSAPPISRFDGKDYYKISEAGMAAVEQLRRKMEKQNLIEKD